MNAKGEIISEILGFLTNSSQGSNMSGALWVKSHGRTQLKRQPIEMAAFSILAGKKV